jgi:1,2-phenylacetyl-CoA epoxidase catalytic subunit
MTMIAKDGAALETKDPLWILNEYRAAEVHGAGAIMRMARLADSTELSADLSRHLRDEATHAWLWTRAIKEMGGEIVEVEQAYQTRLATYFGIPRSLTEFLAMTWASERRGVLQYTEHLGSPELTGLIQRTLRGILKDEHWHVRYINDELQRRVRADRSVQDIMDRALIADERAIGDMTAAETAAPESATWPPKKP